ncbi:hypothetical protein INR49_001902 [Caranx melampygus]|nr:hypothetical protein INR49_001902 [Caranx melampygus]
MDFISSNISSYRLGQYSNGDALRAEAESGTTESIASASRGWGEAPRFWSKANCKERKEMVVAEVTKTEEERYKIKAVSQGRQGSWTTWEGVIQRNIRWADLWKIPQARLSFLIRSTYNTLPCPRNLHQRFRSEECCSLCSAPNASLRHILSGCNIALSQGRYRWHHDQVLRKLAEVLEGRRQSSKVAPSAGSHNFINFVTKGDVPRLKERNVGEWWILADDPAADTWALEEVDSNEEDNLCVEEVTKRVFKLDDALQRAGQNIADNPKDKNGKKPAPDLYVGMKVSRVNVRSQQRKRGLEYWRRGARKIIAFRRHLFNAFWNTKRRRSSQSNTGGVQVKFIQAAEALPTPAAEMREVGCPRNALTRQQVEGHIQRDWLVAMSGNRAPTDGNGLLRGSRTRSYGSLVRSPLSPVHQRRIEHTIQPGETLQGLSLKYGVSGCRPRSSLHQQGIRLAASYTLSKGPGFSSLSAGGEYSGIVIPWGASNLAPLLFLVFLAFSFSWGSAKMEGGSLVASGGGRVSRGRSLGLGFPSAWSSLLVMWRLEAMRFALHQTVALLTDSDLDVIPSGGVFKVVDGAQHVQSHVTDVMSMEGGLVGHTCHHHVGVTDGFYLDSDLIELHHVAEQDGDIREDLGQKRTPELQHGSDQSELFIDLLALEVREDLFEAVTDAVHGHVTAEDDAEGEHVEEDPSLHWQLLVARRRLLLRHAVQMRLSQHATVQEPTEDRGLAQSPSSAFGFCAVG